MIYLILIHIRTQQCFVLQIFHKNKATWNHRRSLSSHLHYAVRGGKGKECFVICVTVMCGTHEVHEEDRCFSDTERIQALYKCS